jgi:hypothetical protein
MSQLILTSSKFNAQRKMSRWCTDKYKYFVMVTFILVYCCNLLFHHFILEHKVIQFFTIQAKLFHGYENKVLIT